MKGEKASKILNSAACYAILCDNFFTHFGCDNLDNSNPLSARNFKTISANPPVVMVQVSLGVSSFLVRHEFP